MDSTSGAVHVFGIRLVGVSADTGRKLLFTAAFVVALFLLKRLLRLLTTTAIPRRTRAAFWTRQAISIGYAILLAIGLASIWFTDPGRLASALGFVTAGLAFALQRVVTALSGYLIILRGKIFEVGDRISLGGVRGDVIGLGFLQTRIMEMGEPGSPSQTST